MNHEQKLELCAQAAHEINRLWCEAHGDTSQHDWQNAPAWQKQSAIKGVEGALAGNTPQQSHESWLEEKRAAGWTWGPVKDAEKKQHPCFALYDELPQEQRAKDLLFVNTVRTVGHALGLV